MLDQVTYTTFYLDEDLGHLLLARTTHGICFVSVDHDLEALFLNLQKAQPASLLVADSKAMADDLIAMLAILDGSIETADVPLEIDWRWATDFQRQVWRYMRAIPLGETRSYGQVAAGIGNVDAVRAVGSACGANPTPLLVPCHRVVRADGSLGEFSLGGSHVKELLLAREHDLLLRRLGGGARSIPDLSQSVQMA